MDALNRRPQLPSLGYLDNEKARRDEEAYQSRNSGAPQTQLPPVVASPTFQHPQGPPPPYSHPPLAVQQLANSLPGVRMGVQTPPESRRTSGDEKDAIKQVARQSLPSISEALGVDNQPPYHSTLPVQQPAAGPPSQLRSTAPTSPTPAKRSSAMEPPQVPLDHYSSTQPPPPPFSQYRHDGPPPPHSYASTEPSRPAFADTRQPLHIQTTHSPTSRPAPSTSAYGYPPAQTSPNYDQHSSQPATSMAPPGFPYGYTPYPPRYAQPTPPANVASGTTYQPSLANAAPSATGVTWKSEHSQYGVDQRAYGDSVKRHLDLYDLEAALNDVTQTSSIMTDFARRYGDRLHQTARSGPSLSTLPGMVEVEDMIAKSRSQLDALSKIREVVIAQQAAIDQQAAEQRQQSKAFSVEPNAPQLADSDDNKNSFAGPDAKKRRGRAAPPGRCHSCNRAETPEWRRGPDGARTLCNACGLHYAKLTRKQNNASKASSLGNSNIRPKENS